jgi:hypothetical protein
MSVRNNGIRLSMVTKEIMLKWRDTREHWDDAKATEFERKYMDELQASVDTAVIVIEKLDKLLAKIKKDCE